MNTPTSFTVLPGMTVSVGINLNKIMAISSALIVPVESVFAAKDAPVDSNQRYVWRVAPDAMTVSLASMAVTIMFGLGFATVLTLIMVPVFYKQFYHVKYQPLN